MSTWTRVEDGHPRGEIKNPNGDGRNYQVTDEAIRTFGRNHMTELMSNLPPLPDEAWTPPARNEVTITTNRVTAGCVSVVTLAATAASAVLSLDTASHIGRCTSAGTPNRSAPRRT